jgi:ribosomal protein S18 acetylase RimI-like enzyme
LDVNDRNGNDNPYRLMREIGAQDRFAGVPMNYMVRKAQDKDLDKLAFFTVAEAHEAEGAEMDPSKVWRGVASGLSNPALAVYWVVETDQGDVVASASVVKEWSDWNAGYYWWIQSLYVIPDHRGRGLPEILIEAVAFEAREQGAADLRLYVHEQNSRAIKAYRRCGFTNLPYKIMSKALRNGE